MATHSSVLAWRIPWTALAHKESDMTERLSTYPILMSYTNEINCIPITSVY